VEKKHIIITAIILLIISGVAYNTFLKPKQETITVSGAFALYPLMIQWSEEYQIANPNVQFEISAGGAGKGMTDALSDLVDLGMVSRTIYDEEINKGAVYVAVAKDAVVITLLGAKLRSSSHENIAKMHNINDIYLIFHIPLLILVIYTEINYLVCHLGLHLIFLMNGHLPD